MNSTLPMRTFLPLRLSTWNITTRFRLLLWKSNTPRPRSRRKRVVMFQVLSLRGRNVLMGSVLFIYSVGFVLMELLGTRFFVVFVGPSQRFAWKYLHGGTNGGGQ